MSVMCILLVLRVCIGCKLYYWEIHHSVMSGRPQICMYGILSINSPFNKKNILKYKIPSKHNEWGSHDRSRCKPLLVVCDRKHSEWYKKKMTFLKLKRKWAADQQSPCSQCPCCYAGVFDMLFLGHHFAFPTLSCLQTIIILPFSK